MGSQYRRGADFERALKKHLEAKGFFVIRSAGSKGPVDLVAFMQPGNVSYHTTYFIQCKLTGKITAAATKALTELAESYGAQGVLATPQNYKEIWRD